VSRLTREKGFTFKQDGEHGFRRVVASPAPLKILEATAIKVCHLLAWDTASDLIPYSLTLYMLLDLQMDSFLLPAEI